MTGFELLALAAFAAAACLMLLVTQTRKPISWPIWLLPVAAFGALAALFGLAIVEDELPSLWPAITSTSMGLLLWIDRLMAVTVAFSLLQNRARAAGMKSEVWVLAVIFLGSLALLLMLAWTLYLERRAGVSKL